MVLRTLPVAGFKKTAEKSYLQSSAELLRDEDKEVKKKTAWNLCF
jgi:hypothetical protein